MKDDIQEENRGDLEEAGIDLSDTESSAKAGINIAAKQTSEGAIPGKGEIHFSEYET